MNRQQIDECWTRVRNVDDMLSCCTLRNSERHAYDLYLEHLFANVENFLIAEAMLALTEELAKVMDEGQQWSMKLLCLVYYLVLWHELDRSMRQARSTVTYNIELARQRGEKGEKKCTNNLWHNRIIMHQSKPKCEFPLSAYGRINMINLWCYFEYILLWNSEEHCCCNCLRNLWVELWWNSSNR